MKARFIFGLIVLVAAAVSFAGASNGQMLASKSPVIQKQMSVHEELQKKQAVLTYLSSLETVLKAQNIQSVIPFLQADRMMLQSANGNLESLTFIPSAFIKKSASRKIKGVHIDNSLSWQYGASIQNVPLYSLFTAADHIGYPQNNPPYEPSNPNPPNHAQNVALDAQLSWTGGDPDPGDTVVYDVYFGTTDPPPLVAENQSQTTYDPGTLAPSTTYHWKIIARDSFMAETVGPCWDFETINNYPPNEPVNPLPSDGATDVDVNVALQWQCNDPNPGDTLTYDVYFGTTTNPPKVADDIQDTSYSPSALDFSTTYYWKIVARDNWGSETEGPEWSFTTSATANTPPYEPGNPVPENGATGVSTNIDLQWSGGDPDSGDTVSYDVYFDTVSPPALRQENVQGESYNPGALNTYTKYYWKIVARDSHFATNEGPEWEFTTGSGTEPTPTPIPCTNYSVDLDMGDDLYFSPGDICYLNAAICNPEAAQYLPLFVILQVEEEFWFAPDWTQDLSYYFEVIPAGRSVKEIIPEFVWPEVEGSYTGMIFWGALTNPEITEVLGDFDYVEFGYGP